MTTAPVMTITEELLAELEEKAKAATPGPWRQYAHTEVRSPAADVNGKRLAFYVAETFDPDDKCVFRPWAECTDNAAYIAAANPATILALVEHIRSLSERLDRMRDVAQDVLWCIDTGPSCQIGVVERCKCSMCVAGRLRVAIAQEGSQHE